ncbi:MAG: hypothetical protein V4685_02480 [Bacteroidota bacterium]
MLENLFSLVKEQGLDSVINNPEVPNEQNDAVLASATDSVAGGLQNALASGGLQNVLSLFGGQENNNSGGIGSLMNNPIVSNIISSFTQKLTNEQGIPSNQASGIAGNLIPSVISSLIGKTRDANDGSFDMNSIIGSLTGGQSQQAGGNGFDFNGILSKFTGGGGLDTDGDGQVELSDIISKVSGGAQQQQQQTGGGGGLMDMIKGFMK